MANKTLQSIKFPGLPDTYVVPQIDDLEQIVNGEYTSNFIAGKNLTANTALQHAIIDDPNACISEHIPVTWGSAQFGFIYTDDTNDTNTYQVWFFDSSNNFLSFKGRTPGVVYRQNLVCPENTAYIIISFKRGFAGVVTDNNLNPVYYTAATEITSPGLVQKIGNLNSLGTTEKSNLVGAINEVRADIPELPITPKDTSFFYVSKNHADPTTTVNGEYVNQGNGNFATNTSYNRTDYVPVSGGNTCLIKSANSGNPEIRYAFYTSQKVYISGAFVSGASYYLIDVPDNAAYIALSAVPYYFPFMVAMSEVDIPFEEYGIAYILPQYIQTDISDAILNLPSKIYALVGYELNIYFENITEEWEKYKWDVTCSKGVQLERGYRITPVAGDVGSYSLKIKASISDASSKEVSTTLVIVPADAGTSVTKSVIVLGDSTTNSGTAVTKLNDNLADDVMTISTLGTRGTSPNNHEGRSGWRLETYFTVESIDYTDDRGHVENPFYNPSTQTFDADYYFTNSGIAKPDWFFINMGINDVFSYETGVALDSAIETCIGYVDSMVASVKSASPSSKIGVCLTIPPNHSQDAFGKAYSNGQTRHRYKKNNTIWVNRLIAEYDNRESEGIYLIPIHTNLDTVYNMGMETLPVNARNTTITYQSPIANGGVHPVESGYWQIADVYTAFLKAHAED